MSAKITFRGWAGHFICANRCRFRLNTLIELRDTRIVVSTVGVMEDPLDGRKFSEVGAYRHFETMAFHAKFEGGFWDADVSREVQFNSRWSYASIEDEQAANDGHYKVVEEICQKLESGNGP